jgi:hypothetical protein
MSLISRIFHNFQSGRSDNSDPGAIQPSHWNDNHDLQLSPFFTALATLSLLTVGTGANNLVQLDGSGKLPAGRRVAADELAVA